MSSRYLYLLTIVSMVMTASAQPDFNGALQKIDKLKPNINYDSFCSEKHAGKSKTACRIKEVPSVGFLVCHKPDLDGLPCGMAIEGEMQTFRDVAKAGIETVSIFGSVIKGVKCAKTADKTCVGFLEQWLDKSKATFEHVSNFFRSNTAGKLASKVKSYTKQAGWKKTVKQLEAISKFMGPPEGCTFYKQICDLQGFFLHDGGFLVSDPAAVVTGMRASEPCFDPDNYPTSKQVKDGLAILIAALQ